MGKTVKQVIQENVRNLLKLQPDESGVQKLIQKGFPNGSAQRILNSETQIGVDQLDKLAKAFKVEPWQLCAPNLGVSTGQVKMTPDRWPFATIRRDRWEELSERHKGVAEDAALQALERLQSSSGKRDPISA
jgi:hypothetical protein